MQKCLLFFVFSILIHGVSAQLPATDIYVLDIVKNDANKMELKYPKYLTNDNKGGYNNQPTFINDKLYITAQQKGDNQTDIYSFDLKEKIKTRITNTPESEYSPQLTADGQHISVVRTTADDTKVQQLWQFPLQSDGKIEKVLPSTVAVGYHFWLNMAKLALFVVGPPHQLSIISKDSEEQQQIVKNIGRCFQQLPDGRLAYVQKISETYWVIKALDTNTLRSEPLTKTISKSEDFIVMSDGTLVMGRMGRIYKFHYQNDIDWEIVADLKQYGIGDISRLAINKAGTKLAIVTK